MSRSCLIGLDGIDLHDLFESLFESLREESIPPIIEPQEVCSKNKLPGSVKSQDAENLLTKHFGCVYESFGNGDNTKVTHQPSGISFSMPNWRPEVGIPYIQTQLSKIGYTRKDLSNAWFCYKNGTNGNSSASVVRVRVICTGRGFGYEVFSASGVQIECCSPRHSTQDQAILDVSNRWGPLGSSVVIDVYKATGNQGITLQRQKSITFGSLKKERRK
jgi:hypothetical protein